MLCFMEGSFIQSCRWLVSSRIMYDLDVLVTPSGKKKDINLGCDQRFLSGVKAPGTICNSHNKSLFFTVIAVGHTQHWFL